MPDDIEDAFVRSLLEKCDRVLDWDRYINETTFATKGFGFCIFEKIEGVWRCMRLLNGIEIDDSHHIEVKPVSEVNNLLNQYKQQIKDQLQHKGKIINEESDLLSEETKLEDNRLKMFIEEEINKRRNIVHKVNDNKSNSNNNKPSEEGEVIYNNNNKRRRRRVSSRSRSRNHRHHHHHHHHHHSDSSPSVSVNRNNNKKKNNEEKRNGNKKNGNNNNNGNVVSQIQPPLPQPPLYIYIYIL